MKWCWIVVLAVCGMAPAAEVGSPGGKVRVAVEVSKEGEASYRVEYEGKVILGESKLGLALKEGAGWEKGLKIVGTEASTHESAWRPVAGERSEVQDRYNQVIVRMEEGTGRRLEVIVRAYDAGAAFCYRIPEQAGIKSFVISGERTGFAFGGDYTCWATNSAQGQYAAIPLSQVKTGCERPLVVRVAEDVWVALGEARLVDHARMKFQGIKGTHTLESVLGGEVSATAPYATPWRVVMVGKSVGQLLEGNDLFLNLNDPCAIADTSWIRPGKVIREVTLTTDGGKACVDFAVDRGMQYILFDAGWYGQEHDAKSDARGVHLDPKRSKGPLDLQEVIRYGSSKGIGVILYVNHIALEKQMDELFPLYEKWGVKGVKFGFVNVGSQKWTSWVHEGVRKAAEHKLLVVIHDELRPTGYSRTYPNLMTIEGISGDETQSSPRQHCTLAFTRLLCGPADNTFCWYSTRIKTTHGHQLALPVVFFSPLQHLFWYDRPATFQGEKELDFWKQMPTTWDETRVVNGAIGEYATIARRSGAEWFVGSINGGTRRQLAIPLAFLEKDKSYVATIYDDASTAGNQVEIKTVKVSCRSVIQADLAANGGQAVRIVAE